MAKLNELLVIGPARFTEVIQGQIAWNSIINKPTTLSGYGITDVYGKSEVNNLISNLTNSKVSKSGDTMTGALHINGTTGAYNENIRLHPSASDWISIVLCGSDNTGTQGTSAKTWGIFTNNGNFTISKNGSSTSATIYLHNNGSQWSTNQPFAATSFSGGGAGLTNLNASNIASGTLAAARLPVVPADKGGTGQTTLNASTNALINALTEGTSPPTDSDYYVAQYAGGGTATTTYHRRKMSALWRWINGKTINAAVKASQDGNGNVIANTYLALSGGTMTGQLKTSFKSSVAIGSYQAAATTLENLLEELRVSSGCMGSVNLTTAYGSIVAGWYNFLYIPHRSGGVNGSTTGAGDNCNYGTLLLYGMTVAGAGAHWRIQFSSSKINTVQQVVDTNTWRGIQNNLTSTSTTDSLSAAMGKTLNESKMPYSGGKFTGPISFQASSLPSKSLSFICGIDAFDSGGQMGWQSASAVKVGSASKADVATYVRDSNNGSNINITYSKAGQSSTSWLASWNNYELGAISPSKLSVGYASSAGALSAEIANDKLPARLRVNTSDTVANPDNFKQSGFYYTNTSGNISNVTDANILTIAHTSGGWAHQLGFKFAGGGITGTPYDGADVYTRLYSNNAGEWTSWHALLSSGNYSAYVVPKTGGTFTGGVALSGRVYGSGDDEGLVVGYASNNQAGVILGSPSGKRSAFYLKKDQTPFWRYNNGSTSYDIYHPSRAGTVALTSDVATRAPAYTYGTTDLIAGSSILITGTLYIVYE